LLIRKELSADCLQKLFETWELNEKFEWRDKTSASNNRLLDLHINRWMESVVILSLMQCVPQDVSELLSSCRMASADSSGQTMKARDPLLPDLQRLWADAVRVWPCHIYSFATPSTRAITELMQYCPLVEIGAGTGYWAHLVRSRGGVVHCFDKDPPSATGSCRANAYHGRSRQWAAVSRGGAECASQLGSRGALFLCYPPPDSDMAAAAVRAFQGKHICYVGEWSGDTGTKAFEKLLLEQFVCINNIQLPNWIDTCYSLTVWRRRQADDKPVSHVTHPVRCSTCGKGGKQLHRCRLTYNIYFCDSACAARGARVHRSELVMRCLLKAEQSPNERSADGRLDSVSTSHSKKRKREEDETCDESQRLIEQRIDDQGQLTNSVEGIVVGKGIDSSSSMPPHVCETVTARRQKYEAGSPLIEISVAYYRSIRSPSVDS
jgi:hypothetical protein